MRASSISLDSSAATSGANSGCLADHDFGLDGFLVMAGLVLVTGFALMPGDLTSHAVLVVANFAAEDGHVFTSYVDLARLAPFRHL